jgi:hypothetical protein
MVLEASRDEMVFSGGPGCICVILEWLEGFGAKHRGS